MQIKTKEQYQARVAKRAPKKKRRVSDEGEAAQRLVLAVMGVQRFNAPPMDLIGSERFHDINGCFPLMGGKTQVPVYDSAKPMRAQRVEIPLAQPGKKYRLRWDPITRRDIVAEK
jgi:hypothetical protein